MFLSSEKMFIGRVSFSQSVMRIEECAYFFGTGCLRFEAFRVCVLLLQFIGLYRIVRRVRQVNLLLRRI